MMAFLLFCRAGKVTTLFVEWLFIPKGAEGKEKRILQPDDRILYLCHSV